MAVELSALPWPVALASENGRLTECNARWLSRFGRCDELDVDFPEAAEKLREVIERRATTGDPQSHPSFLVRAPGEIAPLQLRFCALTEPDADAAWMIAVEDRVVAAHLALTHSESGDARDVELRDTELRDVELAMDGVAMRLQARNWRAFFHNAAAGKALIGLHGETLEVNRALCQLLGRSEHELLHLYARDLRHPDDRDYVDAHYQNLLEGGSPVAGIETRYLHKAGHYVVCLLALSLIRDSRQRPLYFAAEVEDITSRRQAEARLREQARELERANSELMRSNIDLERFAFVASHDLQEPLRKIRVFGDRLETLAQQAPADAPLDANLLRYVDVMTGAARRMQTLVDDLLAYGRLEQRDTPFVPVDLNALWSDLREEFETTLRESGAQLQVGDLPTVRGNPFRLRQLFGNLLSNALKFRTEQPPRIEVRVLAQTQTSTDEPANRVFIEVKDEGIGFDQAHAEAIFEVFARLHGRSRYPGTGVGLSICRRVAHEHGGDVRAISNLGQGARFVVALEK